MIDTLFAALRKDTNQIIFIPSSVTGGKEITAGCFIKDVERSCGFWQSYFDGIGHHIGLIAENSYFWLVQFFGIIASGNIAVVYDYNFSEEDILNSIQCSDTEVAVCDNGMLSEYKKCREKIPFIELSNACCGENQKAELIKRDDKDVVLMCFSSGTSGKRKIVELTNEGICSMKKGRLYQQWTNKKCLLFLPVPLYHIAGIVGSYIGLIGANQIMLSDAKHIHSDLASGLAERMMLVPSMLKYILHFLATGIIKKSQLDHWNEAVCVGAALSDDVIAQLKQLDVTIVTGYGMTETAGAIGVGTERGDYIIEPHMKVKIEDGEIVVYGANVMKGYYGDPNETNRVLKNGWLYTGDMGRLDGNVCYLTGRKKNIIILSNGENVSPEIIEEQLYHCPFITECLVYGEGEQIKAAIFSAPGEASFEERKKEIQDYIKNINKRTHLAWRIASYRIMEQELPKTSSGKIKRDF